MRIRFFAILALCVATNAYAQAGSALSPDLKQSADCVFGILKTTPGVTGPKIDNAKDEFCLEYQPDEKSRWVQPTRFCLQGARNVDHGRYEFMALFPGLHAVGEEPDIHVSRSVMQKWNAQCGVRVNGLFE
jgi:hypothetical protein